MAFSEVGKKKLAGHGASFRSSLFNMLLTTLHSIGDCNSRLPHPRHHLPRPRGKGQQVPRFLLCAPSLPPAAIFTDQDLPSSRTYARNAQPTDYADIFPLGLSIVTLILISVMLILDVSLARSWTAFPPFEIVIFVLLSIFWLCTFLRFL